MSYKSSNFNPTNFLGLVFSLPFLIIFAAFVVYPLLYSAFVVSSGDYLSRVMNDPLFWRSLTNTLIYVGLAVNIKMFLALVLSRIADIHTVQNSQGHVVSLPAALGGTYNRWSNIV